MNLKVANLIAVQLGIFVGIMSWLVFSRLEFAKPRTAAEMRNPTVDSSALVAPVFKPRNPRPHPVEYGVDREPAQPMDEEPASTEQEYDQEIAAQPYSRSGIANGSVAVDSPSYAGVDQEPAAVSPNYSAQPEIVVYPQPAQTIVYAEPAQIVVFSNGRQRGNRRRVTPNPGVLMPNTRRCPDTGASPLIGQGIVPRPTDGVPSFFRPTQGCRPRGNRQANPVRPSVNKT